MDDDFVSALHLEMGKQSGRDTFRGEIAGAYRPDTTPNGLHRLKVTAFRLFTVNYQRGLIDS